MKKILILLLFIMGSCRSDKPMPHYQTKYHTDIPFEIKNKKNENIH